jgi:UDPglucose 6-dehydrogenase
MIKNKISFIGQGWIGKHYADNFEERGYEVIRYALEEPYVQNKERINDSDIIFIAVPTPTTPDGFDDSIIRGALKLIDKGKTVVIKSTIALGVTESIQEENPEHFVMHSPEFLVEATAAHNVANPERVIVGIPYMRDDYKERAREVIDVMPDAPFKKVCSSREAELIKYAGNCNLYIKVIFANLLYDLARESGCKWDAVRDAVTADSRIGKSHMNPIHNGGRGAAGDCFIKDFAAFANMYEEKIGDKLGVDVLRSIEKKNIDLIRKSGKDLSLLRGVYGDDVVKK